MSLQVCMFLFSFTNIIIIVEFHNSATEMLHITYGSRDISFLASQTFWPSHEISRFHVFSIESMTSAAGDKCFCYVIRVMKPCAFLWQMISKTTECWHSKHVKTVSQYSQYIGRSLPIKNVWAQAAPYIIEWQELSARFRILSWTCI